MSEWRSMDEVFNEPRGARKVKAQTSWLADVFERLDAPSDREIDAILRRAGNALSSPDREVRTMMSIDPGSFNVGRPGARRKPENRPLRRPVDEWLLAGGWSGGKDMAGSIRLAEPDSPAARESLRYRWRTELKARGWNGRWFYRDWSEEGGEARMYWWRRPGQGPDAPPLPGAGVPETGEELADG